MTEISRLVVHSSISYAAECRSAICNMCITTCGLSHGKGEVGKWKWKWKWPAAPTANVMQFANARMDSNFNWLLCSLDLRFKTNPSTHDPLSQHATLRHTNTHSIAASGLREVNERVVNQSIDENKYARGSSVLRI